MNNSKTPRVRKPGPDRPAGSKRSRMAIEAPTIEGDKK